MKRFSITEVATYEVEADDEDAALEIFLQSEDINEFFVAVDDREIAEIGDV